MRIILLLIYYFSIVVAVWGQPTVVKEVEQILAKSSSLSAARISDEICLRMEKRHKYVPSGKDVKAVMTQLVNQYRKLRTDGNVTNIKRTIYAHLLATSVSYGQGYAENRQEQCQQVRSQLARALRGLPEAISAFLQCVDRNRDHISADMIVAPRGLGPPLPPGVQYIQRPENVPMYELPDFLKDLMDNGNGEEQYCLQELIEVRSAQSWIAYLMSTMAHFCE